MTEEASLVERARRGDQAAYEAIMAAHQEAAFRLAYLLIGSADDAADVTQDTFIRAFRALDTFDSSRALRPWLLQITRNLASNKRRSWGRYWGALKRVALYADRAEVTAEALTWQQIEAEALWQAIRQLPTSDQEVIYLRYFLELSVSETAEILKVEGGTVKSRLSRALSRLRQIVERDYPVLARESEG